MESYVDHYLRLMQQGLSHEAAAQHTVQRFGVSRSELAFLLYIAHKDFQSKVNATEVGAMEYLEYVG